MNKKQSNLEYKKGYGENYANLRKTEYNGKGKDFTVRELEKLIGVSYTAINLIEKEKRDKERCDNSYRNATALTIFYIF